MMQRSRWGLTTIIHWTHIQDKMDRRQIGEHVLLNHNAYDWTHIQNNNSKITKWYLSNPNELVEITDIIKLIQTYD